MEVQELEAVKINITENKVRHETNAYVIDDMGFLKWFIKDRLRSINNTNRLKFRLKLLNLVRKDRGEVNLLKRDKNGRFTKTN